MTEPAQVTKIAHVLPMSSELLYGSYLTPTDIWERKPLTPEQRAEYETAQEERRARYDAVFFEVGRKLPPTLLGVWSLHKYGDDNLYFYGCEGCDWGGYDGDTPSWPCRTVELIAKSVGVDIEAELEAS